MLTLVDEPDVIPLQVSGTVDSDLSDLSTNELMEWAMSNMWKSGQEGGYSVRHGRRPVSDFGKPQGQMNTGAVERPNFFERAFPCLFPWGFGGIERDKEVSVEFSDHVKWCLQYRDRRFRTHETFPFVTFGILQRRQALGAAHVEMKRKKFEEDARLMSTITAAKLEEARIQEEKHQPIADPAVRLLRSHVHAAAGKVQGTDQSRYHLRSQIWSTSISHGPPSLWLTINPSDLHDPIAQVFAGEEIDLDDFVSTLKPDSSRRARNISNDPYAAAKFFHFMINAILQALFRIKVTKSKITAGMGVLGRVSAYFGTVECQGRGTLHLHILIWLQNTPTREEISELLKTEEFRAKVVAYIQRNIRAYVPGLESAQNVKAAPREIDIAYNRPPNPQSTTYNEDLQQFELKLARTEQVHTCKFRRCLVLDKNGQYRCKRRAPFECADNDYITETGKWGPKRLYAYVNGWCPSVLVNARCNNDIKLLTNGDDTKNITFYITMYTAKKQGKSHNLSAVMADAYAYHTTHPNSKYLDSLRSDQHLLLFRVIHAINRNQEIAAPMVMSYLMGWGDVFRSHTYSPIYWSSFMGALIRRFPELKQVNKPERHVI